MAAAEKPSLRKRVAALLQRLRPKTLLPKTLPLKSLLPKTLRGILLLALPVAMIGGMVVLAALFSGKRTEKATLEAALAKLDAGEFGDARRIAAEVRTSKDQSFATVGGSFFVLGMVMAEDARQHVNSHERQMLHLIASRYLEESRIRGFPPGHEKEGLLMLGRSLHRGGRFQASIPILKEALSKNPSGRAELYYLLADSYLHLSRPNLEQASVNTRRLLAEKHLPQPQRHNALLLQGQIALAEGKYAEGRKALAQIPKTSSAHVPGLILAARMLTDELRGAKANLASPTATELSAQDQKKLEECLATMGGLQKQNRVEPEIRAQADLLIAACLELLGKQAEATAQYARVRKAHFDSPESVAAAFYDAEYQLRNGNTEQAVDLYKRGLTVAGPAEAYHNVWLPLAMVQSRLESALASLLAAGDFARAEKLARSLSPLFPQELAHQWRAKAEHKWGMQLLAHAAKKNPQEAPAAAREAREHFRKAGAHHERLAKLRIATRYYLSDLKNSADDYLAGHDYKGATRVLRALLSEDPQKGKQEAIVGLGEALLAVGQTAEGLKVLETCITMYPKHPATYRARYLSSLGHEELGQAAEARKLLSDNLYNFSLAPESADWRDSIFLLGKIVYHEVLAHETKSRQAGIDQTNPELKKRGLKELEKAEGLFQEAARILEEAVERYPAAPQTAEARYLLAEAHRQTARWYRKRLDVTAIEASRGALTRDMHSELSAALREYTLLIEQLSNEHESTTASEVERMILRNSYFGRADVLFDQGKLEEAHAAYSAASNRYQHEPEALEAYVQIAACYRRLGRMAEARGTLEQARVVLARMKADANFTKTTPYSREQWNRLLTWLSAL